MKHCIALRKGHPALRTGDYVPLLATDDVYAFARSNAEETLVVALNSAGAERQVTITAPISATPASRYEDVWNGEVLTVDDGALGGVRIPPREGRVFVAQR
jgi:glycosidase